MKNEFNTCIDVDKSGAKRSSLPIFDILLWTLTIAFNSFDSNKVWRNPSSCSPDKLSVSFNDVKSLDSAVNN